MWLLPNIQCHPIYYASKFSKNGFQEQTLQSDFGQFLPHLSSHGRPISVLAANHTGNPFLMETTLTKASAASPIFLSSCSDRERANKRRTSSMESVPAARIVFTKTRTFGKKSFFGKTRFTRFNSSEREAEIMSPKRIISKAFASPITLIRRSMPPEPGNHPDGQLRQTQPRLFRT